MAFSNSWLISGSSKRLRNCVLGSSSALPKKIISISNFFVSGWILKANFSNQRTKTNGGGDEKTRKCQFCSSYSEKKASRSRSILTVSSHLIEDWRPRLRVAKGPCPRVWKSPSLGRIWTADLRPFVYFWLSRNCLFECNDHGSEKFFPRLERRAFFVLFDRFRNVKDTPLLVFSAASK